MCFNRNTFNQHLSAMLHIRPAIKEDIVFITEIYNDAIKNTVATFDTEIKSVDDRMQWFMQHDEKHPVIIAEINNQVVGWASLSKWSDRCAYDTTVEESVYVHKDFRGRGIGKALLEIITLEAGNLGVHTILARITEGNESSIHIHQLMGYDHIGVMRQVGKKFGRFLDVHMMQKMF